MPFLNVKIKFVVGVAAVYVVGAITFFIKRKYLIEFDRAGQFRNAVSGFSERKLHILCGVRRYV